MRNTEDIINLLKVGKHFCILPWVHLHASTKAELLLCCREVSGSEYIFGDLNGDSFGDLWQGEAIKKFRSKMLKDEACS